jgi:hypothetical protein
MILICISWMTNDIRKSSCVYKPLMLYPSCEQCANILAGFSWVVVLLSCKSYEYIYIYIICTHYEYFLLVYSFLLFFLVVFFQVEEIKKLFETESHYVAQVSLE